MARYVLTVIGNDRSGLVEQLSRAIEDCGGNWEESHMSELAGKFAGVVLVAVPDAKAVGLMEALSALSGVLDVTAAEADESTASEDIPHVRLDIVGLDRPGLVHEVSAALVELGASIERLDTSTRPAPMSGGELFEVAAVLALRPGTTAAEVGAALADVENDLGLDIELSELVD